MNPGKKTYRYLIVFLLLMLALSACANSATQESNSDLGRQVFTQKCSSCHSLEEGQTVVGPSLAHIATTAGDRLADKTAREYIEAMLVDPTIIDLEGYPNIMPENMKAQITTEEHTALIDFLMELE